MPARTIAICRDYALLHAVLRARANQLALSRETLDEVAGLPAGYTGKLLGAAKVRRFGPISLGPLLGALGLVLVVREDPESKVFAARARKRDERMVRVGAGRHACRRG